MDTIELIGIDLGLRGAACGAFLMIVLQVLQRRATHQLALLGTAMSLGGAFYAIVTAPVIPKSSWWWTLPILSSLPAVFWLWARASFDDDFALKWRHGALWLGIVAFGFAVTLGWARWPALAGAGGRGLAFLALVLALAVALQTMRTWRADLVARRRRLRLAVLAINIVFIGVVAGPGVFAVPVGIPGDVSSLPTAISLFVLATLAGLGVLDLRATVPATGAAAVIGPVTVDALPMADRARTGRIMVDPLLLRRLDHLMTVERAYREEGLAIGALAARLDVPEHRLRKAINEGLGYRNFNAYLNRYRIEDAKAGLSDSAQREVPVLTIAIDAGFQSIGPFNRAFKAETGMTPTEFRREALSRRHDQGEEIGRPRREIG